MTGKTANKTGIKDEIFYMGPEGVIPTVNSGLKFEKIKRLSGYEELFNGQ